MFLNRLALARFGAFPFTDDILRVSDIIIPLVHPARKYIPCGQLLLKLSNSRTEQWTCPVSLTRPRFRPKSKFARWVESVLRKVRGKPHVAEELFSGALREATLFDDLLRKVGGDRSVVKRLIDFERKKKPDATRLTCLQNAISRWENENR